MGNIYLNQKDWGKGVNYTIKQEVIMKRNMILAVALIIISVHMNTCAQIKKEQIIEIGETVTIKSKILNEDRKILVYLPAEYKNSSTRYPVLYTLDGNTYFMASLGIMKYHADFDNAPEMIIVAIPNTNRQRDFTPTKTDYSPVSGGADNFLKFIKEELFPFIEKNYRTQPYKVFSGHSLGGLCVFYALLYEPDMFNAFIAVSSSIWYDDKLLIKKAREVFQGTSKFKKSLYFSVEAGNGEHVKTNQEMAQLLENNTREDFQWKFKWMKDEGHVSLWVRSFYVGFEFVSPWNLPERVTAGGLDAIIEHFNELKLDISEDMLRHFGYNYWRQDNYEQAIRVFKLNVEKFPKSEETYHQLGDVYRDSGQLEIAVKTWKKGIEVAEENSNKPLINILLQHIEDAKKELKKK